MNLIQKIKTKKVKIAIIGLGYVGLPLAAEFAQKGFFVIGLDTDQGKIRRIKNKRSYIVDVPDSVLKSIVKRELLKATSDYSVLRGVDVIIICVPTPLRKTKEPNISFVLQAAKKIARYLDCPQLVILESTTYPGTTEEVILPILSHKGKRVGRDFFLAYSPERVDPGNKKYPTGKIPKVVAGITPACLTAITQLYQKVFRNVIPVSSPNVAETIKLLENTFRTVNIALVDEIALMCHRMGIDVWEVIRGAATKPFGFLPFYPGPGVGGACLPKDPLYLNWRSRQFNIQSRFIELASDITTAMPQYVVSRLREIIGKTLRKKKILILGVAYKADVADTRDSPALEIMHLLQQKGAQICYSDPYVPKIRIRQKTYHSLKLSPAVLQKMDVIVIVTAHSSYNLKQIVEHSPLLFDTRGASWERYRKKPNIFRL